MSNDEKRQQLTATILAGFCANPAVFASNPNSGWGLVNCVDEDIVGYSQRLADLVISASELLPLTKKP